MGTDKQSSTYDTVINIMEIFLDYEKKENARAKGILC
jgi:hypothetical protein